MTTATRPNVHARLESLTRQCTNLALCEIRAGTKDHLFTDSAPKGRTSELILALAKGKARTEIVRRCLELSPELERAISEAHAQCRLAEDAWSTAGLEENTAECTAFTDAWATVDALEDKAVSLFTDTFGGK